MTDNYLPNINRQARLASVGEVQREFAYLDDEGYFDRPAHWSLDDYKKAYPHWTVEQCSYMADLVYILNESVAPAITDQELGEMVGEAEHEGYDGWSDGERLIIELFVADLRRAVTASRK